MPAKKPRRTSERILDVTLAMFNRFGEPNVSTSQLCAELGISPGNLFYHHPTRDALIEGLFERYRLQVEQVLNDTLAPPGDLAAAPLTTAAGFSPALVRLADACRGVSQAAWGHRFLFRDLNDLVARQRVLEDELPGLLRRQAAWLQGLVQALAWGDTSPTDAQLRLWMGPMLASLTHCMGLDGALDPRERLRPTAAQAVERAVWRALGLLLSALPPAEQQTLQQHLSRGEALGPDPWWLVDGGS
jgi:AcrR family transcriptional regulator